MTMAAGGPHVTSHGGRASARDGADFSENVFYKVLNVAPKAGCSKLQRFEIRQQMMQLQKCEPDPQKHHHPPTVHECLASMRTRPGGSCCTYHTTVLVKRRHQHQTLCHRQQQQTARHRQQPKPFWGLCYKRASENTLFPSLKHSLNCITRGQSRNLPDRSHGSRGSAAAEPAQCGKFPKNLEFYHNSGLSTIVRSV